MISSGDVALVYFIVGLKTGRSLKQECKLSVEEFNEPVLDEL